MQKLALTQTEIALDYLKKVDPEIDFEIHTVTTTGDKNTTKPIHKVFFAIYAEYINFFA